eukprot:TRINITY_DN2019_c0_g1_i2.p1 TRINITY_DN2019_c0_g1~~TRINITY_DN2019_c0_g1_i2.p1  ORF type:complete len:138 (+),score=6.50 TRINITY_DN2019_c0_g1_i2:4-417(+)
MKIGILILAFIAIVHSEELSGAHLTQFCRTTMKQLTLIQDLASAKPQFDYLLQIYKYMKCDRVFEKQSTGWYQGKTKRCWRQTCMVCSEEEVYAKCFPGPKEQCLQHSMCGDYGEGNKCQFIHTPAYYECIKKTSML